MIGHQSFPAEFSEPRTSPVASSPAFLQQRRSEVVVHRFCKPPCLHVGHLKTECRFAEAAGSCHFFDKLRFAWTERISGDSYYA